MAATIDSKTKQQAPPNAISCVMVDHSNSRILFGILEDVMKKKEDAMVEKVVHTIGLHCRMHNQARFEVLLPLVEKLSEGGKLAKLMKQKVIENEELLAALDTTKKHLDNKEFVEAVQRQKKADMELMDMAERDILPAMQEELELQDLEAAAEQMEQVKNKAPLLPQHKQFA